MAYTLDQLTAIEESIANGALIVKYADKEVTYRSLDDMIRISNLMKAELGLSSGNGKTLASFSKGYFERNRD